MNPLNFWNRIDQSGGENACWNWQAATDDGGYGITSWQGKNMKAHRMAFFFTHGYLSPDLEICHDCDNPSCCNPAHLFEGTHWDNMQDRNRKGRAKNSPHKGEAHYAAKLTEAKVREMRTLAGQGLGAVEIGRRFGVSHVTAGRAIVGMTWKHVS